MHANTKRALNKLIDEGYKLIELNDDTVIIAEDFGDDFDDFLGWTYEAHRVKDGWITAHYSKLHSQWQSGDMKGMDQSFCYAFAPTLQALADYGVTVYPSPTAALRAAIA